MGYIQPEFRVQDYVVSDAHPDLVNGDVSTTVEEHLFFVHTLLLRPLWEKVKLAPFVTSGYRTPMLNEAVGGGMRSQHLFGEAVDFCFPLAADPQLLVKCMRIIKDNFDPQTGWCYLWADSDRKGFRHIHWAIPSLGLERKNPNKYWYKIDGGFRENLPMDAYKWNSSTGE